ncbi:MAG: hypothetical protein RL264_976 [Bacteroidota bacterium]|jgi:predicted transposase/invertase (TIGR01784 family)
MKARFVNPFTDFGFKKLFGEEASKPQLIDFLNALLPEEQPIVEITYKNTEQLGQSDLDRKALYDIYCENDKGEKFIVELQKAKQNYFKERTVYYSTFPIREQAEKGDWNFDLKAVYCIGILDFTFDDYENEPEKSAVVHTIQLKTQHGKVFYDKLTYIYLEMPNFKKTENELESRLDKWLYFINNLEEIQQIPSIFKETVFENAFHKAELAKMPQPELDLYEHHLKVYRDYKNTVDYAFDEGKFEGIMVGHQIGKEEGLKEGLKSGIEIGTKAATIEMAKKFYASGISLEQIIALTGLTKEEIEG